MDKQKEQELIDFVTTELEQRDHFDYFNWDGFIEDEDDPMTNEDLEYLSKHFQVQVILVPRNK